MKAKLIKAAIQIKAIAANFFTVLFITVGFIYCLYSSFELHKFQYPNDTF